MKIKNSVAEARKRVFQSYLQTLLQKEDDIIALKEDPNASILMRAYGNIALKSIESPDFALRSLQALNSMGQGASQEKEATIDAEVVDELEHNIRVIEGGYTPEKEDKDARDDTESS